MIEQSETDALYDLYSMADTSPKNRPPHLAGPPTKDQFREMAEACRNNYEWNIALFKDGALSTAQRLKSLQQLEQTLRKASGLFDDTPTLSFSGLSFIDDSAPIKSSEAYRRLKKIGLVQ